MQQRCNVAVLGLGAMGAATAYQLAKAGVDVIGIDRYDPPHTQGSSHGDTRITRLSVKGRNTCHWYAAHSASGVNLKH